MSDLLKEAEAEAERLVSVANDSFDPPADPAVRATYKRGSLMLRRLIERVRKLESENARAMAVIDSCCQCRFAGGVLIPDTECHYHECERCVRHNNGEPSDVTKDARVRELEADNQRLREQLCFTGGRGCRTKDAVDEFYRGYL